jgi:antitoxin (DNA-binding transcriptional repressor) of toxin-antitoxin stability system
MERSVSKSKFKPRSLEYFRQIESTGEALIITDRGQPVLKIVPFSNDFGKVMEKLRNVVIKYDGPEEPVATEDWELNHPEAIQGDEAGGHL